MIRPRDHCHSCTCRLCWSRCSLHRSSSLQRNNSPQHPDYSMRYFRRGYCRRHTRPRSSSWLWCSLHCCFHLRCSSCRQGRYRTRGHWGRSSDSRQDIEGRWARSSSCMSRRFESRYRRHQSCLMCLCWSMRAPMRLQLPLCLRKNCHRCSMNLNHRLCRQADSSRCRSWGTPCSRSRSMSRRFLCSAFRGLAWS